MFLFQVIIGILALSVLLLYGSFLAIYKKVYLYPKTKKQLLNSWHSQHTSLVENLRKHEINADKQSIEQIETTVEFRYKHLKAISKVVDYLSEEATERTYNELKTKIQNVKKAKSNYENYPPEDDSSFNFGSL